MTLSYTGNLKSFNGSQSSIYVHMNANKDLNQATSNTDRVGWYNQTDNYQMDLYEQSQESQPAQPSYDQSYVTNYYQAMSNASMMSTPATPVQQVNSPSCHFNNTVINTPLSVASQSSVSYPGSNNANTILPHTPLNNQATFHVQPSSINTHAQLPQPQPTHFQHELSMLEVSPKQRSTQKQSANSRIKPFRLKPIDSIPVLNKNLFARSNLGLKNFLNSLCLSLSLSDSLQNTYRDINFDSCTLCVCNNKYLKGLDYSIYICYDLLNSTVDYYDEESTGGAPAMSGTGSMLAGCYMMNNTSRIEPGNGAQNGEHTTHHQVCTCGFSAIVSRKILAENSIATTYTKFKQNSSLAPYIKLADIVRSAGLGEISASTFCDQLIVLDSNCCNGLFLEDYLEELNINTAHSLFRACLRLKANDYSLQNYLINSVLIREGYAWKRALKSIKSIKSDKSGPESQKQPKVSHLKI